MLLFAAFTLHGCDLARAMMLASMAEREQARSFRLQS
jgi:hypothetical protein